MSQKQNRVKVAPPKKIHQSWVLRWCQLIQSNRTHVLRSTQAIVSRLTPNVLAAPSNLVRALLSIPRCSTRFSSTARPCAMYWSIWFSDSRMNVCSRSA
jgi:hypothetical protein